jgi:ABC-type Na+ efflux pump permease subunit
MPSAKFALDVSTAEQAEIDARVERLDTKAGVVLGFVIVSVAEILGFLLLIAGENHKLQVAHPYWVFTLFGVALASVGLATVLGCLELAPRRTHVGFDLKFMQTIDPDLSDEDNQVRTTLLLMEDARKSKMKVLKSKSTLMFWMIISAAGAIFAYIALVALLLSSLV